MTDHDAPSGRQPLTGGAEERLRKNIAYVMRERGVKRCRLADAAGRKGSWGSMYLLGHRRFPLDHLDHVARFLGVPVAELIGGGGDDDPAWAALRPREPAPCPLTFAIPSERQQRQRRKR